MAFKDESFFYLDRDKPEIGRNGVLLRWAGCSFPMTSRTINFFTCCVFLIQELLSNRLGWSRISSVLRSVS